MRLRWRLAVPLVLPLAGCLLLAGCRGNVTFDDPVDPPAADTGPDIAPPADDAVTIARATLAGLRAARTKRLSFEDLVTVELASWRFLRDHDPAWLEEFDEAELEAHEIGASDTAELIYCRAVLDAFIAAGRRRTNQDDPSPSVIATTARRYRETVFGAS